MTQTSDSVVADDFDPDDLSSNPTTARPFTEIAEARLSRRGVLAGGMLAAAGFLTTNLIGAPPALAQAPGRGGPGKPGGTGPLLGFQPIPTSTADVVVVPPGYRSQNLIPWGTPILGSFPAFRPGTPSEGVAGGNTAAEQAQQIGMHHDGMTYFPIGRGNGGNKHGLLVLNHEYTDEFYLHKGTYTAGYQATTPDGVLKSQNAHGVSVVEIRREPSGAWTEVRSERNRRITGNTPMTFSGPAAGHRLLRTTADPEGRTVLGTLNNCANGETPWGTYLTCEENFNRYFRVKGAQTPENAALQSRYGVAQGDYPWAEFDPRFAVTTENPNEPNRFGWVVEIDPSDPRSTPVKRTALGRLKHEDATVHVARDGRVVVYMGDDQSNEFVYKFVSSETVDRARNRGRSPLDEGTLYVAKFEEDGSGTWTALVHGQNGLTPAAGFDDQGEVLINARQAAAMVGATPMDRPEWTAVDPRTGTVYVTLTNNTTRAVPNGPNPRVSNKWGHIVRWDELNGDHTATSFAWDIFVLAGPGGGAAGSTNHPDDSFGSPDGLWLDPDSRVWIQTDGTQPQGNNQMLAGDPYRTDSTGAPELRRFLTGVVGCEVTGIAMTPDQRTLFINLQHPGETGGSTWPQEDGIPTPRSATVVVTKDDGGVIGT
ncbi:MAG: Putative phosphatase [uncultured Blastococcus sp.]|uniref:Phosphatase n=1 Tax=uncultured Blastococcus sp. TaxID=217144 RepID=A0A6J4HS31_9ACTN|nr:MAG: Putative phosphatase [uncultured Blastococcus sp.]